MPQANHLASFIDRYVTSSPTPAAILPLLPRKLVTPTAACAVQCRCLYRLKLFCPREQVNIDAVINCLFGVPFCETPFHKIAVCDAPILSYLHYGCIIDVDDEGYFRWPPEYHVRHQGPDQIAF